MAKIALHHLKKNIKKYLVSIDYFSNFADIYNKDKNCEKWLD